MATAEQIKAARALLHWKQSDLANAAGISLPSINNIERSMTSPRAGTLQRICRAMEAAGIEFLGESGVQRKRELFEILQYDGTDFIEKQNDDLFSCMNGPADEVLMYALDERMFPKHAPGQVKRYEAYHKKTKFTERILTPHGNTYFLAQPDVYRWLPKEAAGTTPYLVYKNRFVLILWETGRTVIVKNPAIADSFRRQFDYLWRISEAVPGNVSRKLDDPKFVESLDKNLNTNKN